MKKIIALIYVILSFFILSSSVKATSPIQWGAYAGYRVSDFTSFQQTIGKTMNYAAVFIHWGNENAFPKDIADMAKRDNQTVVIYWEAMDYNFSPLASDSRFSYDQIILGRYDTYIKSFAVEAKLSGVPVILIPFEEMNGDWYPWSITKNGNSPQKHVDAYRHIRSFFSDVPNVKFGWAINNDSVPNTTTNQPLSYYPGDAYVDIVGVDGFNFDDPWQTFGEVFDRPINSLNSINKPQMIFSMASAPGTQKADWIREAAVKIAAYPKVTGFIWFNENKEKDWRIWSDANSLSAFQTSFTNSTVAPTVYPTQIPSATPTLVIPTSIISLSPTYTPSPTVSPTITAIPTVKPTIVPTVTPTLITLPTPTITVIPTVTPTPSPTNRKHKKWYQTYFERVYYWR